MIGNVSRVTLVGIAAVVFLGVTTRADIITIDLVSVGNPGNVGELSGYGAGGTGPDRVCGAVGYAYNIGRYEVTAGQYTEFLNHTATVTDAYGLYCPGMWSSSYGCKIQQTPVSGGYTYSVAADYADRPVNYVSYWDAARFANWMHNGQGDVDIETGAYTLNGYNGRDGREILRNPGARWFIPSEDEWYKAAYHKNDGMTGNYFDYPTGVDVPAPGRDITESTDPGNNANYHGSPWPIDSPYYTTHAGEFQLSDSPYGTFDQGGNVWEWNEAVMFEWELGTSRGVRGGSFFGDSDALLASSRLYDSDPPTYKSYEIGFRVASVPEPLFVAGDLDMNGKVDIFDVAVLQTKYGMTAGATWADGDFDGNGTVDIFDVAMMQVNYGYGVAASPSPVPEPSTLVLTVLGVLSILIGWWRQRKAA